LTSARLSGRAGPDGEVRGPKASDSMLRGAGVLVAGRYAVAVLAWTGTVVIVRQLSRADWGRYSLIFGLLGIIGLISDLKLSRIVLSSVLKADDHADDVIGSYVTLRLFIGVVSYVIAMVVVIPLYPPVVVYGTAIAGLNLIILSGAFGLLLLFEARYWLRSVAGAQLLGAVAQFGVTIAIAVAGLSSILFFTWATVINAIVLTAWLLWVVRRVARIRLRIDPGWWWEWAKEAAPLALGAALDTIYFRIDIVMLSLLATATAVGTYSVGYKFSDLLGAIPLAIVTPAMTMLVSSWPDNRPLFRRTFRHACVLLTVVAVGAGVGFAVYAEPLIRGLYGLKYVEATDAARLLVTGQALHFFTMLSFITLVSAGRNRLYPVAMLIGVAINVSINFAVIPIYSYNGSAWATVITEAVVLVVLALGVARIPGLRPLPVAPVGKCLLAGGLMAAAALLLYGRVPWPLGGAVAGVVYLASVHLLRVDGPGGLLVLAREGRIVAAAPELGPPLDPDAAGPVR
jgi:O-antigen/teichoic acid export membrane protein